MSSYDDLLNSLSTGELATMNLSPHQRAMGRLPENQDRFDIEQDVLPMPAPAAPPPPEPGFYDRYLKPVAEPLGTALGWAGQQGLKIPGLVQDISASLSAPAPVTDNSAPNLAAVGYSQPGMGPYSELADLTTNGPGEKESYGGAIGRHVLGFGDMAYDPTMYALGALGTAAEIGKGASAAIASGGLTGEALAQAMQAARLGNIAEIGGKVASGAFAGHMGSQYAKELPEIYEQTLQEGFTPGVAAKGVGAGINALFAGGAAGHGFGDMNVTGRAPFLERQAPEAPSAKYLQSGLDTLVQKGSLTPEAAQAIMARHNAEAAGQAAPPAEPEQPYTPPAEAPAPTNEGFPETGEVLPPGAASLPPMEPEPAATPFFPTPEAAETFPEGDQLSAVPEPGPVQRDVDVTPFPSAVQNLRPDFGEPIELAPEGPAGPTLGYGRGGVPVSPGGAEQPSVFDQRQAMARAQLEQAARAVQERTGRLGPETPPAEPPFVEPAPEAPVQQIRPEAAAPLPPEPAKPTLEDQLADALQKAKKKKGVKTTFEDLAREMGIEPEPKPEVPSTEPPPPPAAPEPVPEKPPLKPRPPGENAVRHQTPRPGDWDYNGPEAPTKAPEPPVPEGMVRLYRGEGSSREVGTHSGSEAPGSWYTSERKVAERHAAGRKGGRVIFKDIPREEAAFYHQDGTNYSITPEAKAFGERHPDWYKPEAAPTPAPEAPPEAPAAPQEGPTPRGGEVAFDAVRKVPRLYQRIKALGLTREDAAKMWPQEVRDLVEHDKQTGAKPKRQKERLQQIRQERGMAAEEAPAEPPAPAAEGPAPEAAPAEEPKGELHQKLLELIRKNRESEANHTDSDLAENPEIASLLGGTRKTRRQLIKDVRKEAGIPDLAQGEAKFARSSRKAEDIFPGIKAARERLAARARGTEIGSGLNVHMLDIAQDLAGQIWDHSVTFVDWVKTLPEKFRDHAELIWDEAQNQVKLARAAQAIQVGESFEAPVPTKSTARPVEETPAYRKAAGELELQKILTKAQLDDLAKSLEAGSRRYSMLSKTDYEMGRQVKGVTRAETKLERVAKARTLAQSPTFADFINEMSKDFVHQEGDQGTPHDIIVQELENIFADVRKSGTPEEVIFNPSKKNTAARTAVKGTIGKFLKSRGIKDTALPANRLLELYKAEKPKITAARLGEIEETRAKLSLRVTDKIDKAMELRGMSLDEAAEEVDRLAEPENRQELADLAKTFEHPTENWIPFKMANPDVVGLGGEVGGRDAYAGVRGAHRLAHDVVAKIRRMAKTDIAEAEVPEEAGTVGPEEIKKSGLTVKEDPEARKARGLREAAQEKAENQELTPEELAALEPWERKEYLEKRPAPVVLRPEWTGKSADEWRDAAKALADKDKEIQDAKDALAQERYEQFSGAGDQTTHTEVVGETRAIPQEIAGERTPYEERFHKVAEREKARRHYENRMAALEKERLSTLKDYYSKKAEALSEHIRKSMSGRVGAGFPLESLPDLVEYGVARLMSSATNFVEFAREMRDKFGEGVKEHLGAIWDEAKGKADLLKTGTKAVDQDGNLLDLYHGTESAEDVAKTGFTPWRSSGAQGRGAGHFAEVPADSDVYAARGKSPGFLKVHLATQKPFDAEGVYTKAQFVDMFKQIPKIKGIADKIFSQGGQEAAELHGKDIWNSLDALTPKGKEVNKDFFQKAGFDAIKFAYGNNKAWLAFDPNQIYSALSPTQLSAEGMVKKSNWEKLAGEAKTYLDDKAKGTTASMGIDPEHLSHMVIHGAELMRQGIKNVGEWSSRMVKAAGEAIRPMLQNVYNSAARIARGLGFERGAAADREGVVGSGLGAFFRPKAKYTSQEARTRLGLESIPEETKHTLPPLKERELSPAFEEAVMVDKGSKYTDLPVEEPKGGGPSQSEIKPGGKTEDIALNFSKMYGLDDDAKNLLVDVFKDINPELKRGTPEKTIDWHKGADVALREMTDGQLTSGELTPEKAIAQHKLAAAMGRDMSEARNTSFALAAARKAGEVVTDAEMDQASKQLNESMLRGEYVLSRFANNKTRAGRVLRAYQEIVGPAEYSLANAKRSLTKAGIHENIADALMELHRKAIETGEPFWDNAYREGVRQALDPGRLAKFIEIWKSNLIGIPSIIANTLGNLTVRGTHDLANGFFAPMVDIARSKLTGTGRERFFGEAGAGMLGYKAAWAGPNGIGANLVRDLADIANLRVMDEGFKTSTGSELRPGVIQGKKGEALRWAFKMMSSGDNAAKHASAGQEIYRWAYREVRKANPDATYHEVMEKVPAKAQDLLEIARKGPESKEWHANKQFMDKIRDTYLNDTYQNPLKGVSQSLQVAQMKHPLLNFLLPFIKTPTNIALETLKLTPKGFYDVYRKMKKGEYDPKHGGDAGKFAEDMAIPLLGSSIAMAVAGMASEGMITGGGSTDQNKNKLEQETGWQPYSLKIGDQYYSYQRIEPLAGVIGMVADMVEGHQRGDFTTKTKAIERLMGSLGENLTNKTFLSGLEGFFTAWSDPVRYAGRFFRQQAGSLVPSVVAKAAQTIDPTFRDTKENLTDSIISRIPFASRTLPAQLTPSGEERQRPGGAIERLISPIAHTTLKSGPEQQVIQEMDRIGYAPSPVRDTVSPFGRKVKLTREEKDVMAKSKRDAIQAMIRVVNDPSYQALPDNDDDPSREPGQKTKQDVLRKVMNRYRADAQDQIKKSYLPRAKQDFREFTGATP